MFRVLNYLPYGIHSCFAVLRGKKGDYLENSHVVFCQNMPFFLAFTLNKALNKRQKTQPEQDKFFSLICHRYLLFKCRFVA